MRLEKISSIEQANAFLERYLPIYAKRFGKAPAEEGDLHRLIPKGMNVNRILCIKTERALRNDFTVAHDKKLYQILDNVRAEKVVVEEAIDGTIAIYYKNTALKYKEIITRPKSLEPEKKVYEFKPRKVYVPPAGHLWRRFKISPHYTHYSQREKGSQKEKELLLVH